MAWVTENHPHRSASIRSATWPRFPGVPFFGGIIKPAVSILALSTLGLIFGGCSDKLSNKQGAAMRLLLATEYPVFAPRAGNSYERFNTACFAGKFPTGFTTSEKPLIGGKKAILYESEPQPNDGWGSCIFTVQYAGQGVYSISVKRNVTVDTWLVDVTNNAVQYQGRSDVP